MNFKIFYCFLIFFSACFSANSSSNILPFEASIGYYCSIVINSPGVMVADVSGKRLNSKLSGGSPGRATVSTNAGEFYLLVKAPKAFDKAPSGVGSAEFATEYNASGSTNLRGIPGTAKSRLKPGESNVTVDLKAVLQDGAFPHGAYRAETIIVCE